MLAFTNSGFEQAIVVVIDRDGSVIVINDEPVARESESVFLFCKEQGYKAVQKSYWLYKDLSRRHLVQNYIESLYPGCKITTNNPYSIVKVYEGATTLIGQHPLENGKTMGLASYGEELEYEPLFYDSVPLAHKFTTLPTDEVCFFGEESSINKDVNPNNYQHYANRAKQVQLTTQYEALKLIAEYVEKTGIKNVCVVGGYALNVVANNYYLKNLPDVAFYFEPVADDTGISLGAAMLAHHQLTGEYAAPLKNNFYHYYDYSEQLEGGKKANIAKLVSMLAEGKSVAIFEGNPEAGPRALGHRSILFDARNSNAKEIVNRIKKREWYRPFAGVILESEFANYFETLDIPSSPYMTINFDAKEETKQLVPGIIHVDGTCRIQTVSEGFLFDLITAFYKKTKCPMILNTSFNLAGEPLVQTKAEAIETLQNSELDAIYFVEEGRILTK
jgi:carbamoyltransferase